MQKIFLKICTFSKSPSSGTTAKKNHWKKLRFFFLPEANFGKSELILVFEKVGVLIKIFEICRKNRENGKICSKYVKKRVKSSKICQFMHFTKNIQKYA